MRHLTSCLPICNASSSISPSPRRIGSFFFTALVKPGKSLAEVDAKSVRKKMKDKAFARSVSRDDIVNGAAEMGVDLEEHIAFCIEAMKAIAGELGLAGSV